MFPGEKEMLGAEYKLYCSFDCTNEASGEITVEVMIAGDGVSAIDLPICQEHADAFLAQGYASLPMHVDSAVEE